MMKRIVILFFLALLPAARGVSAAGGIQGRCAIKGEVVEGVLVYAYTGFDKGLKEGFFKVSAPTKIDGTYKFDLPAGRYYFVARMTAGGGIVLKEGDLYCYYSGSPIDVVDGVYKNVGFNLIRVPGKVEDKKDAFSGVYGTITYEGKLLERVYLFAYKSAQDDFKGPADYVFPSEKGNFKLRVPEGEYYLIARKRKRGGMYGPVEKGDYFNYYYGNPVKVEKGLLAGAAIECITRLDMLETPIDDEMKRQGIKAQIINEAGEPLEGLYLLAYSDAQMKGKPAHISERSDEKGAVFMELVQPGDYFILARSKLGGPVYEGEYYGKYANADSKVTLTEENMYIEINIKAPKFKPIE